MEWANLLRMFQLVTRPRMRLNYWEWWLWGYFFLAGAATVLVAQHARWYWTPLPILVAFGVAYIQHEVFFKWWAERICGCTEAYTVLTAEQVAKPLYTPCLERWVGPVA